jgi:tRNA(Leu) C34 or U34 (ribose-2'-O)-methylase TrmL
MTPADDAVDLQTLPLEPHSKVALILGAEGPGLSLATMQTADRRVRIPIAGHADSLNVGVAAGIGLYQVGVARGRS